MAILSAIQRSNLARTQAMRQANFGFPSKAPGSDSYPIHDAVHARAALSYGSRYLSPSQFNTLRAKIRRKYPTMAIAAGKN
jgi:hypothetical protein